jgi:DNA-binding CsgD family transcriptional regulator
VALACVALGALLPQPVTAVVTPCLTIAYLLVVAVVEIVQGSAQQPVAWDSGIERACSKLSAERGLTPRESEVLVYLAKGRTAAFIADELKISPNTAQTHIKRIHEKLDVSSKDEIIGMVESRI